MGRYIYERIYSFDCLYTTDNIGTIGLLINEIIFDWGRCATLTFAIINVVGLALLAFTYWAKKKTQ